MSVEGDEMVQSYLQHTYKIKYLKYIFSIFAPPIPGGFIFLSFSLLFYGEVCMSKGTYIQGLKR